MIKWYAFKRPKCAWLSYCAHQRGIKKEMLIECTCNTFQHILSSRYQHLSHTLHSPTTRHRHPSLILHIFGVRIFFTYLHVNFVWWNAVKISLQMYIFTRQPLMSFNYIFWKDKMKESDFIPLRLAIWLLGYIMAMCEMYLKEKRFWRCNEKCLAVSFHHHQFIVVAFVLGYSFGWIFERRAISTFIRNSECCVSIEFCVSPWACRLHVHSHRKIW